MIYHNLCELGNNTLNFQDVVYFHTRGKTLRYSVQSAHLANTTGSINAEIFSILDINKEIFCSTYYGYRTGGGDWPTCEQKDYAALTRVVKALYREIEYKESRDYGRQSLIQELKAKLSTIGPTKPILEPLILEKKETTSSNIVTKRKSKIKKIIGEEPIKLNNY